MKTPVCPPVALQQAVMESLRHYLLRANQALSTRFSEPAISWQQRGTIAGTAWPENWEIRINPILLLENQQPFIDEVIPHELAHLLVWKQFGRVAPHGKEWRWMMAEVLNVTPHRTHPFSASTVAGKTWPYLCACQQHMLTLRRHNRVQRQQAKYRCKICGCFLKPSDFPAHSA